MRNGVGILIWNKNELQEVDRKTRKIMAISKELHPRSDVTKYLSQERKVEEVLICCENCVKGEENNPSWYIKNSTDVLLRKIGKASIVNTEEGR